MRCRRCEDSPDYDRDQLLEHATQADHPLCVICRRSLDPAEPQTCRRCLDRARAHLDDIADAWVRLNSNHHHWPAGSRATMPGGDRLVLAGPGSDASEPGPEVLTDPPAVAHALASWAADWAEIRREPCSGLLGAVRPVLEASHAVAYLGRHLQWAANTHPAFDDYAADIRRIRARLNATLALNNPPETGAPCLRCSTPADPVHLERLWTDAGLADAWCCPRCGDTLTPAQYLLAMRAALEAS